MFSEEHTEELLRFGKHLYKLRRNKKLSYRKLAQLCDVEYASIKRFEKGEKNFTFITIIELAKGLGVPVKELMDY